MTTSPPDTAFRAEPRADSRDAPVPSPRPDERDEADPFGFEAALGDLDAQHLRRVRRVVEAKAGPRLTVDGRELVSFASNDYLGLSQHPAAIAAAQRAAAEFGVGSAASPLVCGQEAPHEALERALAEFVGRERALFFGSGYLANVGLVPALAGRGDALFCDALNHACLIDGARLSGATIRVIPHLDLAALDDALATTPARRRVIVTDAVFSMDGTVAPLREQLALAERHDALLLIDDAHGLGVLGPRGAGTAAHFGLRSPRLVQMATLGKSAGVAGAFVAGDAAVIEWVMQRARSYIFATATPAMVVAAVQANLARLAQGDDLRARLARHIERLRRGCAPLPWTLLPSQTAIQPLVVGENQRALDVAAALRERGLWVPAIRPPTVPAGTARLRISLSAAHSDEDVETLVAALTALAGD